MLSDRSFDNDVTGSNMKLVYNLATDYSANSFEEMIGNIYDSYSLEGFMTTYSDQFNNLNSLLKSTNAYLYTIKDDLINFIATDILQTSQISYEDGEIVYSPVPWYEFSYITTLSNEKTLSDGWVVGDSILDKWDYNYKLDTEAWSKGDTFTLDESVDPEGIFEGYDFNKAVDFSIDVDGVSTAIEPLFRPTSYSIRDSFYQTLSDEELTKVIIYLYFRPVGSED